MGEKRLEELANIKFPHVLDRRKAVHLLWMVAKMGDYTIRFGGEFTGTLEKGRMEIYTTRNYGTIWTKDSTNTSFELKRGSGDHYKEFDSLRLDSPGNDYDEIKPDEAKLWKDINRYVLIAFNQKPKS